MQTRGDPKPCFSRKRSTQYSGPLFPLRGLERVMPPKSRKWLWLWLWPALWGGLLGILPHLTQRVAHGTWAFQSSYDDHYYAMIARGPISGAWSLRDPFANTTEAIGVSYAWGLFVPMAKIVAWFGEGPAGFLLGWRLLGGALLGAGLWSLVSTLLRRSASSLSALAGRWRITGLSVVIASLLLADPGFDRASMPLERLLATAASLLHHAPPFENSARYVQFRAVSPVCGLGVLFAALAVLCRPKLDRLSAVMLGGLLGLLFNLYFFFWTTLVGLMLVLLVIQYLPAGVRRWFAVQHPPRLVLLALLIGGLLGLPQLMGDLSSFGDPVVKQALERTPRGLALSWHNPGRWLYLTGPRLWLDCLLVALAAFRVRALRVPALLVLVSFALANSALLTGLQFENYKWLHAFQTVSYVCVWIWALIECNRHVLSRYPMAPRAVRAGLVTLSCLSAAVALVWIPREGLGAPEPAEMSRWQAEIRGLGPVVKAFRSDSSVALPRAAQPVLLNGSMGVLYEPAYSTQSFISDDELIERHALSAWVLNEDRTRLDLRSDLASTMSGEQRPRWQHLRERYEQVVRETSGEALDRFRVRYAVTPCRRPPNPETGAWHRLAESNSWCAWERTKS